MPRQTHKDFYGQLERYEAKIAPALAEEEKALETLRKAAPGSRKDVALTKYRRAVNKSYRATERRRKFLEKYQPE